MLELDETNTKCAAEMKSRPDFFDDANECFYGTCSLTRHESTELIFLFGYDQQVEVYNIKDNRWSKAPQLKNRRTQRSSCSLGEYVYVTGGIYQGSYLNSIERFDVRTGFKQGWEVIGNIEGFRQCLRRIYLLMVPLSTQGDILVFGGSKTIDKKVRFLSDCYILRLRARIKQVAP